MIQVLARAFGLLERLAERDSLRLKDMAAATGLKKPTLCVILKSLTELGYARKTDQGQYAIGPKLAQIAFPSRRKDAVASVAEAAVRELAEEIRESVVAATVRKGERITIAHATCRQTVMVDTSAFATRTFYGSATGRVLLAYMDDTQLIDVVERHGLPGDEWKGVESAEDLRRELREIRRARIAFRPTEDGQALFLAVPVPGPDGKALMALGVSMPASRCHGPNRKKVIAALKAMGERASCELQAAVERPERRSEEKGG